MSALDLGGVLVPAATPFDPVTGDLDVVALRSNARASLQHPVLGLVIGGSTGEALLLDEEERLAALEAARDVVPSDRLLVAGTGAESTRSTVRRCREAAEIGADAVLVQPPAFYRGAMDEEALALHYRTVADASPVPVVVYQVPLRMCTLDLANGLIAELSRHENVVGVKDSRGVLEHVAALVEWCREGFQVLVGNGALVYASLEVGAVGGILGVANLAPAECVALVEAYRAGRSAEAGRLQERIGPLHRTVVGGMGVPGVKAGLDLLGLQGGEPRRPLRAAGDGQREEVRRALELARVL